MKSKITRTDSIEARPIECASKIIEGPEVTCMERAESGNMFISLPD